MDSRLRGNDDIDDAGVTHFRNAQSGARTRLAGGPLAGPSNQSTPAAKPAKSTIMPIGMVMMAAAKVG